MTAPELRDLAMGMGFTGVHAMKKEELLVSIKEEWGIKDEEPAKKKAGKITEVSALKQKIVRLKAEKEAAREGKDKKRVNVLRKRINRLKKMSRQSVKA
ncbi:MAG: transcription termination factor Rho [Deltaproteobacteria bacterium]|nr:transcription termination factor Rho [Deltaproteobacteria bacterium]